MKRREFVNASVGTALGAGAGVGTGGPARIEPTGSVLQEGIRASFPRLAGETFVNAAAGTPLGAFAEAGLRRYLEFQRLGPGDRRGEYVSEMLSNIRAEIGRLIGARESEIGLVHCTKAGEQVVLDGLEPWRHGGNIVTNDMHFSGSLHNLVGLAKAGADVRIVRAENWDVSPDAMEAAMDDRTALVAVTLVSNVNGRVEPVRELAELAHARGALLYADIIQAAGIVPFDVHALGIDFAACNAYKWLFGVHGAGFLFVREDLQGDRFSDRLFPGHVAFNYPPWVERPDPNLEDLVYLEPSDARRYQPGHVSYLAYCALYEGLNFVRRIGIDAALDHTVRLHRRLNDQLDRDRFERISPEGQKSPIVTYVARDVARVARNLSAANTVVSLSGNRVRISAAVYNDERDIDRLAEVMNT